MNLTETAIRALKPKTSAYYSWHQSSQRGTGRIGIKVQPSGKKVFYFRYYINKGTKEKFIQIGLWPEMKLSTANETAKTYSLWLSEGKDPIHELDALKEKEQQLAQFNNSQGSFEQLIHGYVNKMKQDNKRTWQDVLKRLEKECYSHIPKSTKAKDVTPNQIKKLLSAIIQRGAVVQSNRIRSYLMAAFNFGIKADNDPMHSNNGIIFGLQSNPVSIIPKQSSAEKVGNVWLNWEELSYVMLHFSKTPNVGPIMQNLIRICILTGGQRPYEISISQWSSIDWRMQTLLITSDVSKNKREHLIPLTDSAISELQIIKQLTAHLNSNYIFPLSKDGKRPTRTDSLAQAIGYFRKYHPDFKHFTARDLRRTCKTLMGEIGISKEIRDRIQNHALNDVSSKHYDRYDYLNEKRTALAHWEQTLKQSEKESE